MLADFLMSALAQIAGEVFGESIDQKLDRRKLQRQLAAAVSRAERRFASEYRAVDAELTDALTTQTRFADLPSIQAALSNLLTRPFDDPAPPVDALRGSFTEVLPAFVDRRRVDAAVTAFLRCLGQEALYIPQLQQMYTLAFQKASVERAAKIAAETAALSHGLGALRDSIDLLAAPAERAALPPPAERLHPWHNLPQRSYARFVGRQDELAHLTRLLLPHPRSRHFLMTIDGIGGVGKSTLAIELAYRFRDHYADLPPDERFAAIVWVSAKRTLLSASGIHQRQQTFRTLDDLYREIASVFELPAILQATPAERRTLAEHALAAQRTLLIIDNLETADDEELLAFLRELPDPTKAIVTTRHRIDIAYAIRLTGMPESDALALMAVESARKSIELPHAAAHDLYRRTGGIPLAIVWSLGLMSLGHSVESVLRRLGSGHSDIARFCFAESAERIRGRDAERLLLALALFEHHVGRAMLGEVAGLAEDVIGRDDGLAELIQLSLANQKGDRFFLLPLTHAFALDMLNAKPDLERELRARWAACLATFARPYADFLWRRPDRHPLRRDGRHLIALADWLQQSEQIDQLLAILPALLAYYDLVGEWADMLKISEIGLEGARLTGDLWSVVYIQTHAFAWVLSHQGRHDEAIRAITEALDVAQQLGDPAILCETFTKHAQVLRRRQSFSVALQSCGQAMEIVPRCAEVYQPYLRAVIDYELGKIARDLGDWAMARIYFLAARAIFRHDDAEAQFNLEFAWIVLGNLGYVTHQIGNLDAAAPMYQQALEFFRKMGHRAYLPTLQVRLAALEEQRGNYDAAIEHAREALEWSRRLGIVREQADAEALLIRLSAPPAL